MPEGDTVHALARALTQMLEHQTAVRIQMRPNTELTDVVVESVRALGKHLMMDLSNGLTVRSHLGLYGSWHRYAKGEVWRKPRRQAGLVLETDTTEFVCFNPREVQLLSRGGIQEKNLLSRLGPDLATAHIDLEAVVQRARSLIDPDTSLVDLLLDQRIAAGIGNVYKSEILFLSRLQPMRALESVDDEQLKDLYRTASSLIRKNLRGGPRITRFDCDGLGRLWVYGRDAQPCLHCGHAIRRQRAGRDQRSTYWCPRCQPERPQRDSSR